ncbi:ABC transporter permease [Sphingorhabdus arenilitoris]|uniref:ABC transporter permease n=1 Tax=Sphingorhabdus arenilitoris TaxID=1490041 RepID=A0ABV8RGA8_9SPHN
MSGAADFIEEKAQDNSDLLRFTGIWTIAHVGALEKKLSAFTGPVTQIDLSHVERIDTVGAWLVYRTARDHGAQISGASAEATKLIERVSGGDSDAATKPRALSPPLRILNELGEAVSVALSTMAQFLGFIGQVVISFFAVLLHPSRLRWNAIAQHFEMVGIRALGIVGLMSFLIGIVIAQQGAVQLKQFGAEVFTINLIGRLTFRELGVLMTAIMIAGRSGSAFAAQIGTMKITEEIDAMRTIGVAPIEALVLPRTLATVLMMPLLAFYSCIIAVIGGGLLCWAVLEIPPVTFVQRLREVTPMTDFYVGMIKAPVFGAIIAMTGCFQGLQVGNNAEQVGLKTTAAVVQAIFLVIVLDAFFAVFFSGIGWD